jgi:16S rRNA (uracil1498-N3)-methyltransferase
VKLDAQRAEKRLAHWRGIVVAACEQSGRATVPNVAAPQTLAQAAALREGRGFLLDPQARQALAALHGTEFRACTLAIGPEGGWSPRDREALLAAGYEDLRLGPRVLRTETAGIAAIAALQALCGDLA